MSFAQRIVRGPALPAGNGPILLIRNMCDASGKLAWYFVRVTSAKYMAFKRQLSQNGIDFNQFGEVLASGYGDYPPLHVEERMRVQYGFKDN